MRYASPVADISMFHLFVFALYICLVLFAREGRGVVHQRPRGSTQPQEHLDATNALMVQCWLADAGELKLLTGAQ